MRALHKSDLGQPLSPTRSEFLAPITKAPKDRKRPHSVSMDDGSVSPNTRQFIDTILSSDTKRFCKIAPKDPSATVSLVQSHKSGLDSGKSEELILVSDVEQLTRAESTVTPVIPLLTTDGRSTPLLDEAPVDPTETPDISQLFNVKLDTATQQRLQQMFLNQCAYLQSIAPTQKYPAPSATVSRPPDAEEPITAHPDQPDMDKSLGAFEVLNTQDLIPPSGNVSKSKGADIYTDSESDNVDDSQEPSDPDGPPPLYESGGEDYTPVLSQSHRQEGPRYESDEGERIAPTNPIAPRSMRLTDVGRSPRKSAGNWRDPHAAGRRPIRTPSPPDVECEDASLPHPSPVDTSHFSQEDLSFRTIMKEIATLSQAKSGKPKSHFDHSEFPIQVRSQAPTVKGEDFVALETTQAVINALKQRQIAFKNEDERSKGGKTLTRLHMTDPKLNVKTQLYKSLDAAIPMEALTQPVCPDIWMPEVLPDSDIPLQERDARFMETLTRQALNITSIQDHTLAAVKEKIKDQLAGDISLHEIVQTLALSIRDLVKVLTHSLTSIVQLRRDAFLLHAWDGAACRKLRHADILYQSQLFPPPRN